MKTYHITLQGQDYTICLRSYSVEINGTRYKIRSLPARKLLAVLGIFLTLRLSTSENLAPALRVLLSIAYLVVSWAAVFALAFLLVSSGTIYY